LVEKPPWLKEKNVILVDGSEDVKCGENKQYFMLHYSINLFTLSEREFLITDMQETGEKLVNFKDIRPDDIVIGDRAYGTLLGISYLMSRQAGYVLRIRANCFSIYDQNKEKIDLLKRFSGLQEGETDETTVYSMAVMSLYGSVLFEKTRTASAKVLNVLSRQISASAGESLSVNYSRNITNI
jgi:hypothetical protein